jgi:hypothetical protein
MDRIGPSIVAERLSAHAATSRPVATTPASVNALPVMCPRRSRADLDDDVPAHPFILPSAMMFLRRSRGRE